MYSMQIFKSHKMDSMEDAERALQELRERYSEEKGWREIYGVIESLGNGMFRACLRLEHLEGNLD